MNSCVSCGFEYEVEARFCSRCGLPTRSNSSQADPLGDSSAFDEDGVMVLTAAGPSGSRSRREEISVRRRGPRWQLGLVSVAVLALLSWSLARTPTEPVDDVAQQLFEAMPTPDPDEPLIDGVDTVEERADGQALTLNDDHTDSNGAQRQIDVSTRSVDQVDGFDDLYLVATNRSGVTVVDMETGRTQEAEVEGNLIGHHEGDLILLQRDGHLVAVDVAEPGRAPQLVVELDIGSEVYETRMSDAGLVEIVFWDFGAGRGSPSTAIVEVDLASRKATRASVDDNTFWLDANGVAWVPGGGLFERIGDDYRFLNDGFPEVVGPRYVLVRSCQQPDTCERFWIEREYLNRIPRPLPPEDIWNAQSVDDDSRLLLLESERGSRYYDVINEQYLPRNIRPLEISSGTQRLDSLHTVSPDGRYLLVATPSDGIVFYHLTDDRAFSLTYDSDNTALSVQLVPKLS